jgi:hypothetical protein
MPFNFGQGYLPPHMFISAPLRFIVSERDELGYYLFQIDENIINPWSDNFHLRSVNF